MRGRSPLARRYLAGASVAELADEFGVTAPTIHRRLRAEGITPIGRRDRRIARARLGDLEARLAAGESVDAVAKGAGVSYRTAAEHAAAVDPTTVSDHVHERAAEAWAIYSAGATLARTGAQMGVHPRSVRTWLVRAGYELRPPGRPFQDADVDTLQRQLAAASQAGDRRAIANLRRKVNRRASD